MWDIYDEHGEWLGTAPGITESEAIENAKRMGMGTAASAQPCED